MRILSLGTGGFIGAHLTGLLLSRGHSVVGVDIHKDKINEYLQDPRFSYVESDITSPRFDMNRLIQDVDLVIDLVAYANPGIYVKQPLAVFELNFNENLKIAKACVRFGKRLIQFSSCEVYGKTPAASYSKHLINPEDAALATFSEDTSDFILGPVGKHRWIYASAKQLLERVIHAYGLENRLNYTIIRPFNFFGPKIDYLPNETDGIPRVFSHFMEALIKGTEMKLVEGGFQRRCYTHIDDAIDCIYRIIKNPGNVCKHQIFNVGSPENEVTIGQLAEIMRTIYNEKFKRADIPLPEIISVASSDFYGPGYEDSDRRIPDITKARTLLGWEPRYGLHETLEKTMGYYVDRSTFGENRG